MPVRGVSERCAGVQSRAAGRVACGVLGAHAACLAWHAACLRVRRGVRRAWRGVPHHRDSMSSTGEVVRPSSWARLAYSGVPPPAASSRPSTTESWRMPVHVVRVGVRVWVRVWVRVGVRVGVGVRVR